MKIIAFFNAKGGVGGSDARRHVVDPRASVGVGRLAGEEPRDCGAGCLAIAAAHVEGAADPLRAGVIPLVDRHGRRRGEVPCRPPRRSPGAGRRGRAAGCGAVAPRRPTRRAPRCARRATPARRTPAAYGPAARRPGARSSRRRGGRALSPDTSPPAGTRGGRAATAWGTRCAGRGPPGRRRR